MFCPCLPRGWAPLPALPARPEPRPGSREGNGVGLAGGASVPPSSDSSPRGRELKLGVATVATVAVRAMATSHGQVAEAAMESRAGGGSDAGKRDGRTARERVREGQGESQGKSKIWARVPQGCGGTGNQSGGALV